ncbi:signal transduction histidine kinase [Tahibacter aquaticus]|uniref:Sensory/regulatory protein RpfC n=1 Tax=Tahibacter aquaticus TaxID=520092 RepID=A0A4R6Z6M7_9GAMM|nr:ATP-binding protein [Tahibacter aquaticus]TDR47420.1 signal transduction histidine kinase [Tahibacter aquaticus]
MKAGLLKLSIRQQLLGLFGLLLATGATVLVLDTLNERATVATIEQLREDSLAGLRYVKNISDAYGMDVVDTTFRVRNRLMGWEQGVEVLDRATERIQDQWDRLLQTHLTEVQQTLVDDIRRQRESADRAAAKLRAILQSQNIDDLGRFADTELYPAIDPVTTRLKFLSDLKMITANGNLDADARRTQRISRWRVGLSLLAFAIVVVTGRRILRHIYRGVEKLVALAHATRTGDYATPMGEWPRGELGQVAKAFVEMRDTLARNEVELRHSEALATEANRAKTAFLAAMSHEIRTPMIGVVGMLELLGHTALDTEQQRCVDVIDASAQSLLQIIGDILDFSKIEAGRLELSNAATDLRRLLEQSVNNFLGVASSRGLYLSLRIDEGVAAAHLVDPLRLRQVVSNLIANALKFTHKGGVRVELELLMQEETQQTLALRIHDSGIGIGQEQQDRLFTPFAQAEAGTARSYGGTGLGLAICQRLVQAMGGELGLRSQLGEGTSVSVVLSLETASSDAVAADNPLQRRVPEFLSRPPPGIEQAEREHSLILLVDDHPTNRDVIARQLAKAGYACLSANDGEEGLQEWRSGRFALVLADIHMPRMDGYALAGAIRATEVRERRPRTPLIALTANVTKGEAERCLAAGMDDFLGKPVSIAQLAAKLRIWLPHVPFPSAPAPAASAAPNQALPVPAAAPGLVAFDPQVLQELTGGDASEAQRLLQEFVQTTQHDMAELEQALQAGNRAAAEREAHRIKGAARLVGAGALAEYAGELEQRLRGDATVAVAQLQPLRAALAALPAD